MLMRLPGSQGLHCEARCGLHDRKFYYKMLTG
jgi:hypothetical protein